MNRIMVDLETTGRKAGCPIIAIGAVFFTSSAPEGSEWMGPTFYSPVSHESCLALGLRDDPETIAWWARQSPEARKVLEESKTADSLPNVLRTFSEFVAANALDPKSVQMWGNGSDFDNVILSECYDVCGIQRPWGAFESRCYRTLKSHHYNIKLVRSGVHHHALHDAISQAEHAVRLLKHINRDKLTQKSA